MSISGLRAALTEAFFAAEFFDQEEVQFENMPFLPPPNAPWAALYFLPAQPTVATLGPTGTDAVTGIFQINLNYPPASGTADVDAMAEAIRNVFKAGAYFAYSSDVAVVRSCGRSQGKMQGDCFRVIVTIQFYARINR